MKNHPLILEGAPPESLLPGILRTDGYEHFQNQELVAYTFLSVMISQNICMSLSPTLSDSKAQL